MLMFSDKNIVQCSTKMGVVDSESDGRENVCGSASDEKMQEMCGCEKESKTACKKRRGVGKKARA